MDIEQITHETYNKVERLDHDVRQALENSNAGGVDVSGLKTSINSKIESSKSSIKGTDDIDLTSVKDQIDTVKTEIVNAVNDIDLSAVDTKIDSAKSEISQAIEDIDLSTVNTKIDSVKGDIVGSDNMNLTGIYNKISTCHTVVAGDGSVSLPNLNEKLIGLQLGQTVMQNDIDADSTKLDNLASSVQTINSNVVTINSNTATTSGSIETIKQDIEVLKKKMSTLVHEDTSYSGKTFSDYPAGTIIKTYDVDERILNITGNNTVNLPKIYFCSEAESVGTIKVTINFKTPTTACDALFIIKLNDTQICQEEFAMDSVDTIYCFEKLVSANFNTENKGNVVEINVSLDNSVSDRQIIVLKQKIEINSPNADIINKLCNFDVVYLNDGKYHIADCTSGVAKIAEYNAENMNNLVELNYVPTTYETQEYKFGCAYTNYSNTYVLDGMGYCYYGKDNLYHYQYKTGRVKELKSNQMLVDFYQKNTDRMQLLTVSNTNSTVNMYYYIDSSTNSYSNGQCIVGAIKPVGIRLEDSNCGVNDVVVITKNGEILLYKSLSDNHHINLGYGTDATVYLTNYVNVVNYNLTIFIKHYDKIIKKVVKGTNNAYEILESTEIGAYDKFFKMPNNDYFVVKNNELKYFKETVE